MNAEQLKIRLEELEAAHRAEQDRLAQLQQAILETNRNVQVIEGAIAENQRWLEQEAVE